MLLLPLRSLRPLRHLHLLLALVLGAAFIAPPARALTPASLAAANLPGKTLLFTIAQGSAPFETAGGFSIVFGNNGTYTMPIADGNAAFRSGTYTVSIDSFGTVIKLNGYLVNNATVEVVIIPTGNDLRSSFEMYAGNGNKNGTVVFSTGASGAPAITSAATASATVGSPFVYAITANPAATSYTNSGGNAPVAISPGSGVVTGTFTRAGTFTFSFTAANAGGSSAVFTVTVTATDGGGTGGGGGGTPSLVARTAVGWGWNLSGQTSVPTTATNLIAIAAAGQHSLAVKSDGTVIAWPATATTTPPAGLSGVTAVTGGSGHSVALKSDGSLVQWGPTADGARTNFPANNTGFTAISAKYYHTLALKSDGTVVSWGNDPAWGVEPVPAGLSGVKAVAAGVGFDLALKTDGTVVSWVSSRLTASTDNKGQGVVPAGLTGVTAIAAGQFHALALKADGTVVGWGGASRTGAANTFTVPANAASGVVAIACGFEHSIVLKSDGTIVGWGSGSFGQTTTPTSAAGAKVIAANEYFNLALVGEGTGGTGGGGGGGAAPVVTTQPVSQTILTGGSTTLSVIASGSGLSYQWLLNGQAVAGATGASHTVANAAAGAAGVYSVRVTNALGSVTSTAATITVNAPATGAAAYAGTYTGTIFLSTNGGAETVFAPFSGTVSAAGALVAQGGEVTGTVSATGIVTFAANGLGMTSGTIISQRLNASGGNVPLANNSRVFRIAGTGFTAAAGVIAVATVPANLVGYRNKPGQVFQFTVTGANSGAVWGSDVYTDDSSVARAAVHAGVVAVGETKTVTLTILGGQSSYPATTRNGVTTSSWGSWPGSFAFAGSGGGAAVAVPAAAPGFVAGSASLAVGGRLVCPVAVAGGGTYTYQWYLNGIALVGAIANPYIVESVTAANSGTYSVDVTNSLGTTRITAGSVAIGAQGSPVLALQPLSKLVAPGAAFTLATNASGTGLTYQWFRNGAALAGETGAILLRQNVNANDSGNYTVRVSNGSGVVTSEAATVTLAADASRPANISVRTNVATGATVIPGFVVQGTGSKRVLIRAVGPGLGAFGLTGTMGDPKFAVFQGSTQVATNDDWSAANVGQAFAATGAFALTSGSKDAALITDLAAGRDYTVQVTHASGTGGIVLIEVYDADVLTGTSTSKLINVSVRGQTAPGADVLTLGLVVGGRGQRTLLIRGIGPKLATFGVNGTIADPRLQIFDSQQRAILANDDWSNADFVNELALATNYVGAFALDPGSKDAATLSLVEPGAYTIQVSGTAASPTGEALVEVYEVP